MRWLSSGHGSDFVQGAKLPRELRETLAEMLRIGSSELVAQKISTDGWTRKVLLRMRDGNTVEAVLMLYYDRATVCISSQVGCAMGCNFCATGQMGFTRNLTSGEIVEQVIQFNRWLGEHPHRPKLAAHERTRYGREQAAGKRDGKTRRVDEAAWHRPEQAPLGGEPREITAVTTIVFMGMGEPLVNYNHLWNAIRTITSPQG